MRKILIVEDDVHISQNIAEFLNFSDPGLTAEICHDGFSAFAKAAADDSISLIVLDIGLPGLDGINLCQRLRNIGWTKPVIMLTARDTVEDKVRGLESGADDYLIKPFSLTELLARIRVQLRHLDQKTVQQVLQVGDLSANLHTWEFSRAGNPLKLNATLAKILVILMKKSPGVVTRQELIEAVWTTPPTNETLRSHLYLLRNAIDKPFDHPLLHTISGIGWTLRENKP